MKLTHWSFYMIPFVFFHACSEAPEKQNTTEKEAISETVTEKTPPEEKENNSEKDNSQKPLASNLPDPTVAPVFAVGNLEITPKIPALERGMMDHADTYGWSKDSSEFGYCAPMGGVDAMQCVFLTTAGKKVSLDDLSDAKDSEEESDPKKTKAINERIKKMGYGAKSSEWPYGDVKLTWREVDAGDDTKPTFLKTGGLVDGEKKPVFVVEQKTEDYYFSIHPEIISLSPDGKYIGVVGHAFAGEYSDTMHVKIVSVEEFVGKTYNTTGYEYHKKGEYEKAAPWFHKAAYAYPNSPVAMYNLACALAQLQDSEGAEKALVKAIAKEGKATKEKAKKDKDFEKVRSEEWFQKLTN